MVKKIFSLSEEDIQEIESVQNKFSFLENNSAALRYIISEYIRLKTIEEREQEQRITLAVIRKLEDKLNRLRDAMNTVLIINNIDICIPADYQESPVLTKSREYEKEKIAHLKQNKDYKKRKSNSSKLTSEGNSERPGK